MSRRNKKKGADFVIGPFIISGLLFICAFNSIGSDVSWVIWTLAFFFATVAIFNVLDGEKAEKEEEARRERIPMYLDLGNRILVANKLSLEQKRILWSQVVSMPPKHREEFIHIIVRNPKVFAAYDKLRVEMISKYNEDKN